MHLEKTTRIATSALLAVLAFPLAAEDWPHWRGPRFDGTSEATDLATEWDKERNVKWRLELPGAGNSTPIISGERIYLTSTADGSDDLLVMAVGRGGDLIWKKTAGRGAFAARGFAAHETSPASPSPVTDGKHLWALFGTGLLAAFDLEGNELWRVDLEERYGEFKFFFGLSSSPFVAAGRLYLQVLNSNSQLVLALDKATGEEVWKHERSTDATKESLHSYASPFLLHAGEEQQLVVHGADYVTAHRIGDGAELWRHGGLNPKDSYNPTLRFVATPVWAEGLLVVPTAKRGPVYGLDPKGARGDITGADDHRVWRLDRGTPDVPSPVVKDGLVYLAGEGGSLTCLDAETGEKLYEERVHGTTHRGSPVYADGKIFMTATDGTVSVVKAGREYVLLAQNSVDERIAASIAVSDGTIYLRSNKAVYAVAEGIGSPAEPGEGGELESNQ